MEELQEKHLRLAAEYDNFRKRTQKEKEALTAFVVAETAAKFLPLLDSLSAASLQKEAPAEKIVEGLEKILQVAEDALSAAGVEEIDTTCPFNPDLHNAVMHVEDAALGQSVIAEVFQKGYQCRDKVIRHAMVKVAN